MSGSCFYLIGVDGVICPVEPQVEEDMIFNAGMMGTLRYLYDQGHSIGFFAPNWTAKELADILKASVIFTQEEIDTILLHSGVCSATDKGSSYAQEQRLQDLLAHCWWAKEGTEGEGGPAAAKETFVVVEALDFYPQSVSADLKAIQLKGYEPIKFICVPPRRSDLKGESQHNASLAICEEMLKISTQEKRLAPPVCGSDFYIVSNRHQMEEMEACLAENLGQMVVHVTQEGFVSFRYYLKGDQEMEGGLFTEEFAWVEGSWVPVNDTANPTFEEYEARKIKIIGERGFTPVTEQMLRTDQTLRISLTRVLGENEGSWLSQMKWLSLQDPRYSFSHKRPLVTPGSHDGVLLEHSPSKPKPKRAVSVFAAPPLVYPADAVAILHAEMESFDIPAIPLPPPDLLIASMPILTKEDEEEDEDQASNLAPLRREKINAIRVMMDSILWENQVGFFVKISTKKGVPLEPSEVKVMRSILNEPASDDQAISKQYLKLVAVSRSLNTPWKRFVRWVLGSSNSAVQHVLNVVSKAKETELTVIQGQTVLMIQKYGNCRDLSITYPDLPDRNPKDEKIEEERNRQRTQTREGTVSRISCYPYADDFFTVEEPINKKEETKRASSVMEEEDATDEGDECLSTSDPSYEGNDASDLEDEVFSESGSIDGSDDEEEECLDASDDEEEERVMLEKHQFARSQEENDRSALILRIKENGGVDWRNHNAIARIARGSMISLREPQAAGAHVPQFRCASVMYDSLPRELEAPELTSYGATF